jgi:hypothetical protein
MSEPLIVEFYQSEEANAPEAIVLAGYGGDGPERGAGTLAAFFASVKSSQEPRFDDANLLAARFVCWHAHEYRWGNQPVDFRHVRLIPTSSEFEHYLIARVFAHSNGPKVKFVSDSDLSMDEISVAANLLRQSVAATLTMQ